MTWPGETEDEDKQEVELLGFGSDSNPRVWFTGAEDEPILLLFQAKYHIEVWLYNDLEALKKGEYEDKLPLFKDSVEQTILGMGSPSFESVEWAGSLSASKIVLTFEFQIANTTAYIAKAIYEKVDEKDGTDVFDWKTYPLRNLNDLYKSLGFRDTFGSRSKFNYKGDDYYLVETKKGADDVVILADSALSPLAVLSFELPEGESEVTGFTTPSISETVDAYGLKVFAVSLQSGSSSFVYFVRTEPIPETPPPTVTDEEDEDEDEDKEDDDNEDTDDDDEDVKYTG